MADDNEPLVDRDRDFDEIQELVSQCNMAVHDAFDAVVRDGQTPGLYEAAGAVAGWACNLGYAVRRTERDPTSSKKIIAWATIAAAKTLAATFGAAGAGDVELIMPRGDTN